MEGEKPHYEEALVESEGRIVYLGSLAKAREKSARSIIVLSM